MTFLEVFLELKKRGIVLSVTPNGLKHEGGDLDDLVESMKQHRRYVKAWARGEVEMAGVRRLVTLAHERCLEAGACLWLSLDCLDKAAWTDPDEGFTGMCLLRRPLP
jgi:hypothetical protein